MRMTQLVGIEGIRWTPDHPTGVGALVLAGSSGRVELWRARLFAGHGAIAESIRWFGGPGQHAEPWEIPLEVFIARVESLASECDRVLVIGTSFGAEAALLAGAHSSQVAAVVAFAPTDLVWAGVRADGSVTSHWTLGGEPVPFMAFDDTWVADADPPAYAGLYQASRARFAERVAAATIPVERIPDVTLVAGGDDRVWPAVAMAESIRDRRTRNGLHTTLVTDPTAGHRALLPGEPIVRAGTRMMRGGTEEADRRLGDAAWPHLERLLRNQPV